MTCTDPEKCDVMATHKEKIVAILLAYGIEEKIAPLFGNVKDMIATIAELQDLLETRLHEEQHRRIEKSA
jgi:hypothetical protein